MRWIFYFLNFLVRYFDQQCDFEFEICKNLVGYSKEYANLKTKVFPLRAVPYEFEIPYEFEKPSIYLLMTCPHIFGPLYLLKASNGPFLFIVVFMLVWVCAWQQNELGGVTKGCSIDNTHQMIKGTLLLMAYPASLKKKLVFLRGIINLSSPQKKA